MMIRRKMDRKELKNEIRIIRTRGGVYSSFFMLKNGMKNEKSEKITI